MQITLKEWLELDALHEAALAALDALASRMQAVATRHEHHGHAAAAKLLQHHSATSVAQARMSLACFDPRPQRRYIIGEKHDPNSYRFFEPACCPEPRLVFLRDDEAEAGVSSIIP